MTHEDFILKGPQVGPIPDCSLGEYLISKIRSHPPDLIIQVDAETGAQQTIGELLSMSIRLSEGLKNLGLKENDIVGMMCRNCFEANEIVLGTWLSGAAVSPVTGNMTVAEMKHFLEISKPKFLFCDEEAIDNATKAVNAVSKRPSIIFVGNKKKCQTSHKAFQEVLVDTNGKNYTPNPINSPSTQLVAVPWSSGTTGLPKAVAITHKNFIFQDIILEGFYPVNTKMVILQNSHFFWITGLVMFLNSLTKGAKIVFLKNVTVENILKAIEQYKTEWSLMAPLLALSVVRSPNFEKHDVSSMKAILVGGSPLTESIGSTIMEKWKDITIIHSYGSTEVSGVLTSTCGEGNVYSVGKVLPGIQLKVVDETGKPLKANELGEIVATSPGIVRGYLNNEEATKELFDSDGWLRTGDLGYYNESGQVFLIDRLKEMIKIMNMQIAPAEIENVILSIPGIKEAGVVGLTKDDNKEELLALVVKEKNSTVTEKDIHAHIASDLSDYKKITGGIYFVDSLPKTGSEKLNRKELRNIARAVYSKACK